MKKPFMIMIVAISIIVLMIVEVVIIKSTSNFEPKLNIAYAKKEIPAKTKLTSSNIDEYIEFRNVGLSYAHKRSIRNKTDVTDKMAKVNVESGEMLLSSKFGSSDEMEEIKVLDNNNRLFTVEFKPDQANAWWLLVDQYVDIIYIPVEKQVNAKPDAPNGQPPKYDSMDDKSFFPIASIKNEVSDIPIKYKRVENVRVAAIIDDKFNKLSNVKRETTPKYVTFEVNKDQASLLAYAKGNGRLELSVIPTKKSDDK